MPERAILLCARTVVPAKKRWREEEELFLDKMAKQRAKQAQDRIDAPIIVPRQQPELSLLDKVVVLLLQKKDLPEGAARVIAATREERLLKRSVGITIFKNNEHPN